MTTTPLPPLPNNSLAPGWYTSRDMRAYAQQARADLEAENKRLKRELEVIANTSQDQVAAALARAALKEQP